MGLKVYRWRHARHQNCPVCDKFTIQQEIPKRFQLYQCCQCGSVFAWWPWLCNLIRRGKPVVKCNHWICPYRAAQKSE